MSTKSILTSLLFATIAILIAATPASADGFFRNCNQSLTLGGQEDYLLQDLDLKAEGGGSVSQDMLATKCQVGNHQKPWTVIGDLWTSIPLSGNAKYGTTLKSEYDAELTVIPPKIWGVQFSGYVGYYALALPGGGLNTTADDYFQLWLQAGIPISLGSGWTTTPFERLTGNLPAGYNTALGWTRTGLDLDGPMTLPVLGRVSFHAEAAYTMNLNPRGDVPYRDVARGEVNLSRPIPFLRGWSGTAGVKWNGRSGVTPTLYATRTWHW